jgi:hypothetical protein
VKIKPVQSQLCIIIENSQIYWLMGKKGGWVDGWREGDKGEGAKGSEASLPWRKHQQKGEVSHAKIALERSESFSI